MKTFTKQDLDKILDNHKLWLSSGGEKGKRANLRSADLSSVDLRSANLRSADLSSVDLRSADLRYADLRCADLRYADLRSADLRYANLSCADLRSADLRSADLRCADLRSVDLRSANLRSADLRSAELRYADLRSADLRYANLDYSAFPLWCGGLDVNIDDRIAIQLLYHFVRNVKTSPHTSKGLKSLCRLKSVIKWANKFHRAEDCGKIEED